MEIIWTIQARRQLRHGRARVLCEKHQTEHCQCQEVMDVLMDKIRRLLTLTFKDARNIVVLDQLTGYRQKHDMQVLLVEVDHPDQGGPCVVKIGPKPFLEAEYQGWKCCQSVGLRHDLVLLPLTKGEEQLPEEVEAGQVPWMTLVYGDAQQFIGGDRTVFLEDAVLNAVQYGNPSIQSIGFVLVELLERLGHLLYSTSFVEDPDAANYVFRMPRVVRGMNAWKAGTLQKSVRSDVNALVERGASRFIDPVDYFEHSILPHFDHEVMQADGTRTVVRAQVDLKHPASTSSETASRETGDIGSADEAPWMKLSQPAPTDLVPRMLRGCAHGDLHGRNILVGLVHNRALWPTVFDYEDMGPCELPGWDFVKLETELKIRAWRDLLPRDEPKYLEAASRFEIQLDEQTERYHLDGNWPLIDESSEPLDRLRSVLLEIRHQAAMHLGKNRGRSRQWLEEYYFLLGAYGVNAGS